jgi:hypothetical protein
MKRVILAAAFTLAAGAAIADPIARAANGDSVRFTQAECPAEIAALAPLELRERLRKAHAHIGGPEREVHDEPGA